MKRPFARSDFQAVVKSALRPLASGETPESAQQSGERLISNRADGSSAKHKRSGNLPGTSRRLESAFSVARRSFGSKGATVARSPQRHHAANGKAVDIVKLSRDQIIASLEKGARRRTGLSAQVMLRRYRKGRLTDPSRITDLIALSNLLHKNDPILVG